MPTTVKFTKPGERSLTFHIRSDGSFDLTLHACPEKGAFEDLTIHDFKADVYQKSINSLLGEGYTQVQ